ncbi:hypothetical protein A8C32_03675 [Flavivirga aquatica]|uniref:Lipoprotein n=1 Tax=Flavivirga aquatica TaxID=1849968 RepID=A0A1E5TB19_9FLAO|nr:hypothetical protein [Flavivirga aquatica]OEK08560.1 hypothetical protein A8C32_03675 [Flavivirga aquatica]
MKKLMFLLGLFIIYSCQIKSQNGTNHIVKELLISASEFDDTKSTHRDFSVKKRKKDTVKVELRNNKVFFVINNKGIPYDENRVTYLLDSKRTLINVKEYENEYYLLMRIKGRYYTKNKSKLLNFNTLNLFKLLIFSILIVNFNKIILDTNINNKDFRLVKIYDYICEKFEESLQFECERNL